MSTAGAPGAGQGARAAADLAWRLEQQLCSAVVGVRQLRQANWHAVVAVRVRGMQDGGQLLGKEGQAAPGGLQGDEGLGTEWPGPSALT